VTGSMWREVSSAAVCMIPWFLLSGYDPDVILKALDVRAWCLTLPVLCRQVLCPWWCPELGVTCEGAPTVPGVVT